MSILAMMSIQQSQYRKPFKITIPKRTQKSTTAKVRGHKHLLLDLILYQIKAL